jgi:dynein heavy chain
MITACKSYVTIRGSQNVWSQPQSDVIDKLKDCIKLNNEYQSCFQRTKEKLAQMPNEKAFDFSEMYIFGKFDTFTKRCQKIIDIFNTFNSYSTLQESKIEGR